MSQCIIYQIILQIGDKLKKFLIVLFAILLMSCVVEKKPTYVDPSVRIKEVKGLSMLPPQGPNWSLKYLGDTQAVFGKKGADPDSSYIVQVTLFRLPEFETPKSFLQYVSKNKDAQQPKDRFKGIQKKREVFADQSTYCVKFHDIAEDKKAQTSSGVGSMILEVIGKTCQHPKNKTIGVDFGYSYRYSSGNEDPELKEKANAFMKEVQFTEF